MTTSRTPRRWAAAAEGRGGTSGACLAPAAAAGCSDACGARTDGPHVLLTPLPCPRLQGRTSNCYRIAYRSMDRSLTDEEINALQEEVRRCVCVWGGGPGVQGTGWGAALGARVCGAAFWDIKDQGGRVRQSAAIGWFCRTSLPQYAPPPLPPAAPLPASLVWSCGEAGSWAPAVARSSTHVPNPSVAISGSCILLAAGLEPT